MANSIASRSRTTKQASLLFLDSPGRRESGGGH
jgi:hypothetical protein